MARYTFTYRGNEIKAIVNAETEGEARCKLDDGHDIESIEVALWSLWPGFWELIETTEATQ